MMDIHAEGSKVYLEKSKDFDNRYCQFQYGLFILFVASAYDTFNIRNLLDVIEVT